MTVPTWVFLALAAALSAIVGALAAPGILGLVHGPRTRRRATAGAPIAPAAVRSAIEGARAAIEGGEPPRETIVRLYGRLLRHISKGETEFASSTAQEIERTRLADLHVAPASAQAITLMFEEARYSTHPLDRETAERFVGTLRAIERDLVAPGTPR